MSIYKTSKKTECVNELLVFWIFTNSCFYCAVKIYVIILLFHM